MTFDYIKDMVEGKKEQGQKQSFNLTSRATPFRA
jgi:hypothetical protein